MTTLVVLGFLTAIGTSLAFEGMLEVWSQKLFPTLLRATAQGTVTGVARVVAAAAAAVTPILVTTSPQLAFAVVTGRLVIGLGTGSWDARRPSCCSRKRAAIPRTATARSASPRS